MAEAEAGVSAGGLSSRFGFTPPSRLHAWLLHVMAMTGAEPPPIAREGVSCPVCGRRLERSSCRFCGAYVGGGVAMHYQG